MKKVLSLGLLFLLVFSLSACGKKDKGKDTIAGEWKLQGFVIEGKEIIVEDFIKEMIGDDKDMLAEIKGVYDAMTISITEDNKVTIHMDGEPAKGTIKGEKGKYVIQAPDEDDLPAILKDGKLTVDFGGQSMIFGKK